MLERQIIIKGIAGVRCDLRSRVPKPSDPQSDPDCNKQWRYAMNWDQIKGDWKQVTGKVKEQWGKLTDDEITQIDGKRDQLVGRVQERYGLAKEMAEKQVKEWESRH